MNGKKVKVNDRVKRAQNGGCFGTVKEIKTEVTAQNAEAKERGIMIVVGWDNGTISYVGPDNLTVLKD